MRWAAAYLGIGVLMTIGTWRYVANGNYHEPPSRWAWPFCVIAWPVLVAGFLQGLIERLLGSSK